MNGQGGGAGEFDGRLALVTGAAQGIGAATASRLAQQGARLALCDRDEAQLRECARRLRGEGAQVAEFVCDVADLAQVAAMVERIERELGEIAHLAHVAGILRVGAAVGPDPDDWDACMAVNARGAFAVAGTVAARMRERGRGSIVAVGSNAASAPRTGMAAYAASKAAATQYLRCLALELAPFGVRCNIVSPGSTDTAMQRAFADDEAARQRILRGDGERFRLGIPLGRIADPEDVAETICFLLSERARHITLHDLRVDGGATLDA
ncbi:2,3-dihydro-2,3-dihydroxybenzoate dehydrogenase [Lysobacter enzymogenes]|uniref:2,3-dihydro-2,3-dihydroxybenzoate dehydrogenase n=1 Tax=Lysobacter enzymogenes TaxID=69 RepID=UPI001A95FB67|nr:2,3-dihydro-2,3-dihydroxybenzoate dehydrogenase [Lysobacter enzymogenes]QQP97215.1 2,3-dihydro-2,3-dihydroxybenzoate dehydrogenase [Lysobacter enzymogenes]